MLLKCKLSYQGETWHFQTNVECDKYFFTLEKDKWYEINVFQESYEIKINEHTIVYDAKYFIERHFYSDAELRREKIKKLLNGKDC